LDIAETSFLQKNDLSLTKLMVSKHQMGNSWITMSFNYLQ